jgi:hypothetical protein
VIAVKVNFIWEHSEKYALFGERDPVRNVLDEQQAGCDSGM